MKISKKFVGAITLVAATISLPAMAADESNKTVQTIGSQFSGASYVIFNEPLTAGCLYNAVYLPDPNTADAKNMLAILLNAQSNGRTVRVTYSQAANGFCTASLVAS